MARFDEGFFRAALVGYEAEKARIDGTIAEIRAQLGQRGPGRPKALTNGTGEPAPVRRTMSAAGRRRVAAAQRKRWAALKEAQAGQVKPRKRRLSAAGRKAIIAATKKRWAAIRAAKAKAA